jgi:hypothetical protein
LWTGFIVTSILRGASAQEKLRILGASSAKDDEDLDVENEASGSLSNIIESQEASESAS